MARLHAEASATIDAPPEVVYDILADYREGHPKILPPENFSDLQVEQGGRGEGTIVSFKSRVGGVERTLRVAVTEPQPGRVLRETDTASTLMTTFTVTPVEGGKSRVRIATDWDAGPDLMGLFERLLSPGMLRAIYAKELRRLDEVAASTKSS